MAHQSPWAARPSYGAAGYAAPAPAYPAPYAQAPAPYGAPAYGAPAAAAAPYGAGAPGFGGAYGAPAAGAPNYAGAAAPAPYGAYGQGAYAAAKGSDQYKRHQEAGTTYDAITALKQYSERSFEMLRFEDYTLGRNRSGQAHPAGPQASPYAAAPAGNPFGAPAGAAANPYAPAAAANPFGAPAAANPFGAPAAAANPYAPAGANPFGAPAAAANPYAPAAANPFGAPAAAANPYAPAAANPFGAPAAAANPYAPAAANPFGAPAAAAANPFGAPAGANPFGAPAAPAANPFGAPAAAANPFGAPAAAANPFGAPAANPFGAPAAAANPFGAPAAAANPFAPAGAPGTANPFPSAAAAASNPFAAPGAAANPFAAPGAGAANPFGGQNLYSAYGRGTSPAAGGYGAPVGAGRGAGGYPQMGAYPNPQQDLINSVLAAPVPPAGLPAASMTYGNNPLFNPDAILPPAQKKDELAVKALPSRGVTRSSVSLSSKAPKQTATVLGSADWAPNYDDGGPSETRILIQSIQSAPSRSLKHQEKAGTPALPDAGAGVQGADDSPPVLPARGPARIALIDETERVSERGGRGVGVQIKTKYQTIPSPQLLAASKSLHAVPNFVIRLDGVAQVKFLEPVDLSQISDLDTFVEIRERDVTINSENMPHGSGLNVKSEVTFHNCFPKSHKPGTTMTQLERDKWRTKFAQQLADQGVEGVHCDPATGDVVFIVPHWSRYRLQFDDDDQDANETTTEQPTPLAPPTPAFAFRAPTSLAIQVHDDQSTSAARAPSEDARRLAFAQTVMFESASEFDQEAAFTADQSESSEHEPKQPDTKRARSAASQDGVEVQTTGIPLPQPLSLDQETESKKCRTLTRVAGAESSFSKWLSAAPEICRKPSLYLARSFRPGWSASGGLAFATVASPFSSFRVIKQTPRRSSPEMSDEISTAKALVAHFSMSRLTPERLFDLVDGKQILAGPEPATLRVASMEVLLRALQRCDPEILNDADVLQTLGALGFAVVSERTLRHYGSLGQSTAVQDGDFPCAFVSKLGHPALQLLEEEPKKLVVDPALVLGLGLGVRNLSELVVQLHALGWCPESIERAWRFTRVQIQRKKQQTLLRPLLSYRQLGYHLGVPDTFSLIEALFGEVAVRSKHMSDEEATNAHRRKALLDLLRKQAFARHRSLVQANQLRGDDEILSLVCCGAVEEAVALACRAKHFRLATLISQFGAVPSTAQYLSQSIQKWQELEICPEFFSSESSLFRIYAVLGGVFEPLLSCEFLDWKNILIVALLVCCGGGEQSISFALSKNPFFASLSQENSSVLSFLVTHAPPHLRPVSHWQEVACVDFKLVQLYCAERQDQLSCLTSVLSVCDAHTPHDASLPWFIQTVLHVLFGRLPESLQNKVCLDFVEQLAANGLWIWGVYVAQFAPSAEVRERMTHQMLWLAQENGLESPAAARDGILLPPTFANASALDFLRCGLMVPQREIDGCRPEPPAPAPLDSIATDTFPLHHLISNYWKAQ